MTDIDDVCDEATDEERKRALQATGRAARQADKPDGGEMNGEEEARTKAIMNLSRARGQVAYSGDHVAAMAIDTALEALERATEEAGTPKGHCYLCGTEGKGSDTLAPNQLYCTGDCPVITFSENA